MKVTKEYLKKVIKEELNNLEEVESEYAIKPGESPSMKLGRMIGQSKYVVAGIRKVLSTAKMKESEKNNIEKYLKELEDLTKLVSTMLEAEEKPKYQNDPSAKSVYCSSCGGEFKVKNKNTGFSHCEDHKGLKNYDA